MGIGIYMKSIKIQIDVLGTYIHIFVMQSI
jgi:hypothetical protein